MAKEIDKEAVLEFLELHARGKANCMTGFQLRELFGGSGSGMRGVVNQLRVDGQPIGSCGDGYYYATTKSELNDTLAHLNGRIYGMQIAVMGLMDAQRKLDDEHPLS